MCPYLWESMFRKVQKLNSKPVAMFAVLKGTLLLLNRQWKFWQKAATMEAESTEEIVPSTNF